MRQVGAWPEAAIAPHQRLHARRSGLRQTVRDREIALAAHPGFTEKLLWGGKVVGAGT